jgi:hypothetical protein
MTTELQTAATIEQCEDLDEQRKNALAKFLECDPDDVTVSDFDDCQFDAEGKEWLVLTDNEATEKAREYIDDSLWAFNSSFLAGYTGLDEKVFTALSDGCESSNDAVRSLIVGTGHDLDDFADEAISADGRGHFLNTYDGEENEQGEFFIYRIN